MGDLIGFLKEDWQNLPLNYRYIFFAGVFLIILAWLGDHWGDQQRYQVPIFQSNEDAFQTGFYIIGVGFLALLMKQIWIFQRILRLRRKYPFKHLDQEFHLVNFQGWVYLLDEKSKRRFHVKNQQTAIDLGFLNEWQWVDIPRDASSDTEITLRNGKKIKLEDYPDAFTGIHTQGVTAT